VQAVEGEEKEERENIIRIGEERNEGASKKNKGKTAGSSGPGEKEVDKPHRGGCDERKGWSTLGLVRWKKNRRRKGKTCRGVRSLRARTARRLSAKKRLGLQDKKMTKGLRATETGMGRETREADKRGPGWGRCLVNSRCSLERVTWFHGLGVDEEQAPA